ncbi:hypothetical protein RBA41_27445 [Massilia sp. CCM 9210]|uniref:hypothetical protein n=1 Tax=Massilia scottii TaxID=3057166 RepID=UPI002796B478|nr:hypothetical protein [Massilia sp. CCM 9210]MDQ1817047.1 hypothetical protein [Massilia sp. CCM 9210]
MNFYAPVHGQSVNDRVLFRVGAGIAISIAVHGLLLFAYRQGLMPSWREDAEVPREALVVSLRAPEPAPTPTPKVVPQPKPTPAMKPEPATTERAEPTPKTQTARARQTPAESISAPDVIALPEKEADAPAAPEAFTVAPPSGAPQFDPDAARKFAREIATKPDPARAGMAVAQIPPKPYATETKAARLIAGAKRRDCKDGIPGGLLAPLVLLLDKKDSGCKW